MKKIGFIDYYISEWHANNYPAWIKEVCKKAGLDYEVSFAWAMKDVSQVDGKTTTQWCEEFGINKCDTVEELCAKSDFIVILAPSNPEMHLPLVKASFPHAKGKRFYIDKTFAQDLETAKEIFALAKLYDISFFSTSALRYADEIQPYANCEKVVTHGGGGNFEEYIIHQAEMLVKTMGTEIVRAKTMNTETGNTCYVEFSDERVGEMNYDPNFGFKVALTKDKTTCSATIVSPFFMNLMLKILTFFEHGEKDFCGKETLAVMALREAVIKSKENNGCWVDL